MQCITLSENLMMNQPENHGCAPLLIAFLTILLIAWVMS